MLSAVAVILLRVFRAPHSQPQAPRFSTFGELENFLEGEGGSCAIDLLTRQEEKLVTDAEKAGIVKIQNGSWADSDYVILPRMSSAK